MTTVSITAAGPDARVRARPGAALRDVVSIAGRALRAVPRELETIIPPIFIALFFFVVNIGTLQRLTESHLAGFDIKAFMLPTAILLGVTGVSRAGALVLDIQSGYLDRLLLTPVRRMAILIGHMLADVAIACMLVVPIVALALGLGVRLDSGPVGVVVFLLMGCAWSLAFAGFGYAIALKTGNPAAVNSSFLLFFPFLFMTSSYVPRGQLSGWLGSIATWEPGDLRPRGPAIPGHPGMAVGLARQGRRGDRCRRPGEHVTVPGRAAGTDPAWVSGAGSRPACRWGTTWPARY
jgi:ABC-2 type transport system permease protein